MLADIRGELPPLRGIFHLAGVLDDGVSREQTRERFDRVMAPKVARGLALARSDARACRWICSCCSRRPRRCWVHRGKATTRRPTPSSMRLRIIAAAEGGRR